MPRISDLIEYSKQQLIDHIEDRKAKNRTYLKVGYNDFREMMRISCEWFMVERNDFNPFSFDPDNERVIRWLHAYATGEPSDLTPKINPYKGILMMGSVGAGKTILLCGFAKIISEMTPKVITIVNAVSLAEQIRERGIDYWIKKPLLIDDLGKEVREAKSFGTNLKPMTDLFNIRYDTGAWTLATANYKMETFTEKYGEHTVDRFNSMFNVYTLIGQSRRR